MVSDPNTFEHRSYFDFLGRNEIRVLTGTITAVLDGDAFVHTLREEDLRQGMLHVILGYVASLEFIGLSAGPFREPIVQSRLSGREHPLQEYPGQQAARIALDALLHKIPLPRPRLAVDLGTSNGETFQYVLDRIGGADCAVGLEYHLTPACRVPCVRANLDDQLPITDDSVDLVTAVDVLGLLAHPPMTIANTVRVLRPGGLFIVVDRNFDERYFQRNAQRLGLKPKKLLTQPVTIPEHERTLTTGSLLDAVRTMVTRPVREYNVLYSCAVLQKR